jgi:hypothetical protein
MLVATPLFANDSELRAQLSQELLRKAWHQKTKAKPIVQPSARKNNDVRAEYAQ